MSQLLSRRHFLARAGAAAAAPMMLPARLFGAQAPSNQITLGFIGVGGHGTSYNLNTFLQEEGCRAVAVCDVFTSRMEQARTKIDEHYRTTGCRMYGDFRDLLAQDDIDAVVISTPDHWHVPISMLALEAGKDVQCEKPTLTIDEGRKLVESVKKHDAIFQTGLEDRSVIQYHMMAEAVRNGAIGKLQTIEVGLPHKPVFPREEPQPVPQDLNYAMWLGPAPEAPYSPTRTNPEVWRQIRDYSGGTLTDWGAHLMDTAQVGNVAENSGPVSVKGEGVIPEKAMNDLPNQFKLTYTYANGVVMKVDSEGVRIRFNGTDGWVGNTGWRGPLEAHDRDIYRTKYPPETNKMWPRPAGEHRNFLDCIRSRKPTTYTAEALHRLSTAMHIGNIAMELGRPLTWDPDTESFAEPDADRLRSRPARDDWKQA